MPEQIKLETYTQKGTKISLPATIERVDGRIEFLKSPFALKDELKAMKGSKWLGYDDPPRKIWSVEDCQRNRMQLDYLQGVDVYAHFDQELVKHEYREFKRNGKLMLPMEHQFFLADTGLTYHYQIWAAEMRTGKTLAAQMVIENSGVDLVYWVGPKTSIPNIKREFKLWGFPSTIEVQFFTYEGFVRLVDEWDSNQELPKFLVCDESSRLKNPTSQRSQAIQRFSDMIRDKYGLDGYVIEMSGTPSPKKPTDWWSQCLASDTWILTANGPRQISQLIEKPTIVRVWDSFAPTKGFYRTGEKLLYLLETEEGYSVKATDNHPFLKNGGDWCQLKDLRPGDKIDLANKGDMVWGGECSFGDGYLLGFLSGDGSLDLVDGLLHARLPIYGKKKLLISTLLNYLPTGYIPPGENPVMIQHKYLSHLARNFKFDTDKGIPEEFESRVSSNGLRGFLRGLFDTDGSVDYNRLRITLSRVSKSQLLTVQRMLSYLGIRSSLQTKKKKNAKLSSIDGRVIKSPETIYILHVTGDDAARFLDRVGFNHPDKREKLTSRLAARHHFPASSSVTVEKITELGVESTYDIEVPGEHCFAANGLLAHNCEIAWPGFLKEGSVKAMELRLAFLVEQQFDAGMFKKNIGWRDDESKCNICGATEDEGPHDEFDDDYHRFEPSVNEVNFLYERLKGLVTIKHRKDCMQMPEVQYRKILCKPTESLLRVAEAIVESAPNAMTGMTLLRELSDGFQYRDIVDGKTACNHCSDGTVEVWTGENDTYTDIDMLDPELVATLTKQQVECPMCHGTLEVDKRTRIAKEIPCPKEKALKMLLDENEEQGRIVLFAGFTGSVDRIAKICLKEKWDVVRCDQGTFQIFTHDGREVTEEPLDFWANLDHPRVAFDANPESGGMSLTLNEARTCIYWSNTWKPEYRVQSEARINPTGDDNHGVQIVDLIHLPSDERMLNVIRENRRIELMTMGEIMETVCDGEGEVLE